MAPNHTNPDVKKMLSEIWKQSRTVVNARLRILKCAAESIYWGTLDAESEARATLEAHTLRGELATFGFASAATVAASAEELLKNRWRRTQYDAQELLEMIALLREGLNEVSDAA